MKPNHETIYLVPTDYDGGQLTYSWCDCPAPGEGMDPADAIKYVRADLVPASNEVLARRIVELTNERDQLRAQVEQLQEIVRAVAHIGVDFGFGEYEIEQEYVEKSRKLLEVTPAQCLASRDAELKAQTIEEILNHFGNKFRKDEKLTVKDICWMLNEHLNQLRQQAIKE